LNEASLPVAKYKIIAMIRVFLHSRKNSEVIERSF
jgi:hypothetical protein